MTPSAAARGEHTPQPTTTRTALSARATTAEDRGAGARSADTPPLRRSDGCALDSRAHGRRRVQWRGERRVLASA